MGEELPRRVEEGFDVGTEIGCGHRSYTSPLVTDTDTHTLPPQARPHPTDEAMCARARERYTADRKSRFGGGANATRRCRA